MHELEKFIRSVPDFPTPGVIFRDITPLLESHFNETIDAFASLFREDEISKIDAFAGIDARGFIFAAGLARHFGKNFKMVRKAGKIPPPFSEINYKTEYSSAGLQVSPGEGSIVIIDDVLATGGTLTAAADLCLEAGYQVTALAALIDLQLLRESGFEWNGIKPRCLIQYS